MSINVEVNPAPTEKPFPKLMVSSAGRIVYFICSGSGFSLGNHVYTPEWCTNWKMDSFKDYEGSVTISNVHKE